MLVKGVLRVHEALSIREDFDQAMLPKRFTSKIKKNSDKISPGRKSGLFAYGCVDIWFFGCFTGGVCMDDNHCAHAFIEV